MLVRALTAAALIGLSATTLAQAENTHWPNYKEGDFTIAGRALRDQARR